MNNIIRLSPQQLLEQAAQAEADFGKLLAVTGFTVDEAKAALAKSPWPAGELANYYARFGHLPGEKPMDEKLETELCLDEAAQNVIGPDGEEMSAGNLTLAIETVRGYRKKQYRLIWIIGKQAWLCQEDRIQAPTGRGGSWPGVGGKGEGKTV